MSLKNPTTPQSNLKTWLLIIISEANDKWVKCRVHKGCIWCSLFLYKYRLFFFFFNYFKNPFIFDSIYLWKRMIKFIRLLLCYSSKSIYFISSCFYKIVTNKPQTAIFWKVAVCWNTNLCITVLYTKVLQSS